MCPRSACGLCPPRQPPSRQPIHPGGLTQDVHERSGEVRDAPRVQWGRSARGDWSSGGREGCDHFAGMRLVDSWEARTAISGVIPARQEASGAVRFRRGLVAPVAADQATRSGRRPRSAPRLSRRRRTGPRARRLGTTAGGSDKARPPSRECWRGGGRGRFGPWSRSRRPFLSARSRRCRCPDDHDRAANGEVASPLPGARRGIRVPRPRSARRRGCGRRDAASGASRPSVRS